MCEETKALSQNESIAFFGVCVIAYLLCLVNVSLIISNGIHMCRHKLLKPLILGFYFFSFTASLSVTAFITSFLLLIKGTAIKHLIDISWLFMNTSYWFLTSSLILTMYQLTLCLQVSIKEIDTKQLANRLNVAIVAIGLIIAASSVVL